MNNAHVANRMRRVVLHHLFVLARRALRYHDKVIKEGRYQPSLSHTRTLRVLQLQMLPPQTSALTSGAPPAPLPFLPLGGAYQALISSTFSPSDAD